MSNNLEKESAKILNSLKITLIEREIEDDLHVEIKLPSVFHRASKSESTHEPWGMYGTDLMV